MHDRTCFVTIYYHPIYISVCSYMQDPVLASTSRFIGQQSFVVYKAMVAIYFVFWCIWWPVLDGIAIYEYLTYWSFYLGSACEYAR